MNEKTKAPAQAAGQALDDERGRLQTLVTELLETNQELRQKVERLEERLHEAGAVYALLLP